MLPLNKIPVSSNAFFGDKTYVKCGITQQVSGRKGIKFYRKGIR